MSVSQETILKRVQELKQQAEEVKRQAETQITALLTAANELEKLLEKPTSEEA